MSPQRADATTIGRGKRDPKYVSNLNDADKWKLKPVMAASMAVSTTIRVGNLFDFLFFLFSSSFSISPVVVVVVVVAAAATATAAALVTLVVVLKEERGKHLFSVCRFCAADTKTNASLVLSFRLLVTPLMLALVPPYSFVSFWEEEEEQQIRHPPVVERVVEDNDDNEEEEEEEEAREAGNSVDIDAIVISFQQGFLFSSSSSSSSSSSLSLSPTCISDALTLVAFQLSEKKRNAREISVTFHSKI